MSVKKKPALDATNLKPMLVMIAKIAFILENPLASRESNEFGLKSYWTSRFDPSGRLFSANNLSQSHLPECKYRSYVQMVKLKLVTKVSAKCSLQSNQSLLENTFTEAPLACVDMKFGRDHGMSFMFVK